MVQAGITDGVLARRRRSTRRRTPPRRRSWPRAAPARQPRRRRKKSKDFLAKAAAEKGATKTESGSSTRKTKAGEGETPKATDKVKVHYHGTLTDGTVFDSSWTASSGHVPAETPSSRAGRRACRR